MSTELDVRKEIAELRERIVRLEVKIEELSKRWIVFLVIPESCRIIYRSNTVDPYFRIL